MSKRKEMDDVTAAGGSVLRPYYCKWSGKHAFTIDCHLDDLPMRRTDNARIIDTTKHVLSLYLEPGQTKLLRRKNGNIERQYRYNLGRLPVAYKSLPESQFLYVMDDAVEGADVEAAGGGATPVPPCVVGMSGGAGLVIDVDDKGERAGIIKVRSDVVKVQLTTSVANEKCNTELLEFLAKALALRLSSLSVISGRYKSQKVVLAVDATRDSLHKALQVAVTKGFSAEAVYKPSNEPKNR